jgi:hypothetical protein
MAGTHKGCPYHKRQKISTAEGTEFTENALLRVLCALCGEFLTGMGAEWIKLIARA